MKRLRQALSKKTKTGKGKSNTKPPPIAQPQIYHHIPLGSGGILSREASDDLLYKPATFVGTTGTLNTVGVFFEISDTQCFAAHINAFVTPQSYNTNYKTTARVREALTAKLNAAVLGERTKRMRDSLVITCARLSGQEARAAEVVAKTVREWLGAELSLGGRVSAAGMGFVAGWPGKGSLVFEKTPVEGWRAVHCGIGEGAWSFGVEEAELEVSEEAW
jgi:hypothetical protein